MSPATWRLTAATISRLLSTFPFLAAANRYPAIPVRWASRRSSRLDVQTSPAAADGWLGVVTPIQATAFGQRKWQNA